MKSHSPVKPWSGLTSSLDPEKMAIWYVDYLTAIHRVGEANPDLLFELLELDRATADGPDHERVRGLPKIVDKIIWWIGREEKVRGVRHRLFYR